MNKPKPDFGSMISDLDLPEDPGETARPNDHTVIRSYEHTSIRKASERKKAARKIAEAKTEPADYIQRSLYAREETFERFRKFAFESRRPAQELYREGLYLALRKYGLADGLRGPEDV
jgi:hypothetical protein